MIITNLIIMVYEMYNFIFIIVLFFANVQAETIICGDSFRMEFYEKCDLASNVSSSELSWCVQPMIQKAIALIDYHVAKNNSMEASKDDCPAVVEMRTCFSIVMVCYDYFNFYDS